MLIYNDCPILELIPESIIKVNETTNKCILARLFQILSPPIPMLDLFERVKACLFDMDGLLINTEDIYTLTLNRILKEYGLGPLTWDVKIQLQGLPGPEAGKKIIETYKLPLTPKELETKNIEIQNDYWPTAAFLPGALELLKYLKSKNIPIALCTSSNKIKFKGKTSHLGEGFNLFDAIVTGDDERIPSGRGKPFPDVWQVGLKSLNDKFNTSISPSECLVFEDGIIGVQSGRAFGAHVIWVPHQESLPFIDNAADVLQGQGEQLNTLEELELSKYGL